MKQLNEKLSGSSTSEAGNTLGDFFQGKVSLTTDNKKLYEKITKGFAKSQLRLKEIYFYESIQKKGKQISLLMKKRKKDEGNQHKTSSSVVKFHDNGENEAIAKIRKR